MWHGATEEELVKRIKENKSNSPIFYKSSDYSYFLKGINSPERVHPFESHFV